MTRAVFGCVADWVTGVKNALTLDGEFTSQQLRALADWMENKNDT